MKEPKEESKSGGVGFFSLLALLFIGLLALLFIGLKLGGVIDWSWWWVLAPLWWPFAFVLLNLAVLLVAAFISELADLKARKH